MGFGGIVTTFYLADAYQGEIGDGDDSFAGVPVHTREGMELMDVGILQSCLLEEFTLGTLQCRLIHFQESTGEGPTSLEGFDAPFHQKDIQSCSVESEDHAVGCDTWMRVFVMILKFFHNL